MIKRILVGLGGTPFTTVAVQRAVELAQAHNSHLTGVTVMEMDRLKNVGPVPPGASAYAQRMAERRIAVTQERVHEAVDVFKTACTAAGISHTVEMESGDPFDLMIDHARYHDLTIFGLKSLFDYGITESPKDSLIRLVSQGVRPILAVSQQYRIIRKALVAFSGSMESAKAMRRFVQMRLWPEVKLELVHFSNDVGAGADLLKDAAEYCQAHGFTVTTQLINRSPDSGLLAHAEASAADIVVMGNSVRNLMFRQILGSTVLSVIQAADRPLFLAQ